MVVEVQVLATWERRCVREKAIQLVALCLPRGGHSVSTRLEPAAKLELKDE